jgi:hypothetical protein
MDKITLNGLALQLSLGLDDKHPFWLAKDGPKVMSRLLTLTIGLEGT